MKCEFLLLLVVVMLNACTPASKKPAQVSSRKAILYTCSMHSQIIREQPGDCPICGMALVQKAGLAQTASYTDLNTVLRPVNSTVISSMSAILPRLKKIQLSMQADGILAYDDRAIYTIASRYSGRIEKIYLTYVFQDIEKGQRILDVYSPELVTAQQDLLYLALHPSVDLSLFGIARVKLILLGMTRAQISQLLQSKKPFYRLPVYSPYQGHVHELMNSNSTVQPDVQPTLQPDVISRNLGLKEGQYITKGQTLFRVVDPSHLWAQFKIDRNNVTTIKVNDPLEITFPDLPGQLIKAKVNFIEPELEPGDRNTTIRVYLSNESHALKVNTLVRATIQTGESRGLWVPRTAVYSLGRSLVVWVKNGGFYKVRPVIAGLQQGAEIQILRGLGAGDSIARDAQYLTDSESFIHTKGNDQ